ncbi:FadR family transcriptional regulator [Mycetocola manganoxydans]|uniref:FadR family transcriptional regulator n=1 Tax=Mycetocola manganoxydans TaxID=699879 RepID=A0A3L6ZUE7_9MICO|nr:FCD domain-containing protein [Mycetocola manganoxydans]RLP71514.1 FadR family transcriptional regulator [Mycetocola manganoxydans]GHD46268.1 GntR family transcriptional regulator [Mycetocola manganoxydans]
MTDEPRAWQVVLEAIERDLLDGRLRPGDHLPGERALSADLGVGRSSVREALRVLEVLGLIRTSTGSGPNSGAIIVALPGGGMSALMRLQVAATGFAVEDVVKTRLVLESAVAADLAGASPRPSLAASVSLLDAMESELSAAEFLALDAEFHLTLADASGNQVITATMAGLRSSIESYARLGAASVPSWPDTAARLMREHRGIINAIESGDSASAGAAVHSHIAGYYAETNFPTHRLDDMPA